MSDIDLFLDKENLQEFIKIAEVLGYKKYSEKKWEENHFKTLMHKEGKHTLEIHTQLFQNPKSNMSFFSTTNSSLSGFKKLSFSDLLVHLSGHYVYQHTYLKLFWLYDIYFLLAKNNFIVPDKSINISKKLGLEDSLRDVLYLIDNFFLNKKLFKEYYSISIFKKKLLNFEQISNPKPFGFNYLMLKHLAKGGIKNSLAYDFYWLKSKLF